MILILGHGFLGKTLATYFEENNILFKIADKNYSQSTADHQCIFNLNLPETYGDTFNNIETVIHLIHPTVPANSQLNPDIDLTYNIKSNEVLLEHIINKKIKNIIYVSTGGAIYGYPEYLPIDEIHTCHPISNYGKGKLLLEKLYIKKCSQNNIVLKIIRPSNIFGKYQEPIKPQGAVAHIIDCIKNNYQFHVWGNGQTKKDYLYADDFTTGIISVLSNFKSKNTIYNLSSGTGYSLNEIILYVETIFNKKLNVVYENEKEFDVKNILLSNQLFKDDFNWKVKFNLQEGLNDFLKTK